jgi:hypothetical protein
MSKANTDTTWLLAKAEQEANDIVSVGGLICSLSPEERRGGTQSMERVALAKLVELRRRQYQLSAEALAAKAEVALEEVVCIERGAAAVPEPRTVNRLAEVLELPKQKLLQLAGLFEAGDNRFREATVRFAARPEPVAKLLPEEQDALEEYVKVLAEA